MYKKAAFGQAPTLLDWIAFITLIIVIVLSTIMFNAHSSQMQNKINEILATQDSKYLLLNVLRTPVKIDGIDSDVSQLISLWYLNPEKYESIAETEISKILDDFYDGEVDWGLTAKEKSIQTKNLLQRIQSKLTTTVINQAETHIPLHYNPDDKIVNITLKIYLNTVKEDTVCYNLMADACEVNLKKLCSCDVVGYKPLWKCETTCERGCNPIKEKCK